MYAGLFKDRDGYTWEVIVMSWLEMDVQGGSRLRFSTNQVEALPGHTESGEYKVIEPYRCIGNS